MNGLRYSYRHYRLPLRRLISGELRVPDVEKIIEDVQV